jgi:hypothetical protein
MACVQIGRLQGKVDAMTTQNMTSQNVTVQYPGSAEWDHATVVARQVCARVFRDGGAPADALDAFGLAHEEMHDNWRAAVDSIAHALCQRSQAGNQTTGSFKQAA